MSEITAAPSATVKLTIDGKNVEVKRGTTILEAASEQNIYIPTLCYLKKLLPIGSCRVCSVEVGGVNGPVMSCVTPVVDDMKVTTQSDTLRKHREQMIQYILVNHPLDCPVCERSGECSLQNKTFEFGVTDQVFGIPFNQKIPVKDWGVIRYDRNLCIMCERCVKICREVQGQNAYVIEGTGYEAKINTPDGEKLDCDFCGQCVAICPVGALNSGIVLSARSWEVKKTESVCPHCAVGCSYHINVKNGRIVRITSDDDIGVNNGNLCVRGRFGFEAFQTDDRIKTPLVREGVKLEPVSWDTALGGVASKLTQIKDEHGPDSVAVVVSERITNEDAYVLQKMLRAGLGVNRINTMSNLKNSDLNSGLFDMLGDVAQIDDYRKIGDAGSFFFFGCDAALENPVIANMVRAVMRDKGTPLYIANARNTDDFFPAAKKMIRYDYGRETELVAALINALAASAGVDDQPELTKSAAGVTMAQAAKNSGVAQETIEGLARELGESGPALIFIGKEIHDHPISSDIVGALSNLARLTGGKILPYREYSNTQGVNDMGIAPTNLPGYLKVDEQGARAHYSGKWDGADLSGLTVNKTDIFEDLSKGKIKALMLVGVDPTVHMADGQFIREAIQAAEYVVATDAYITEISILADVVLPTRTLVERDGTYTNNEGRPQLIRKAVEPVGESKPEWEIFRDIGARVGLSLGYKEAKDVTDEIASSVPVYDGVTHSRLHWDGALVSYADTGEKARTHEFRVKPLGPDVEGEFPLRAIIGNSLFHLDSLSRHSQALNSIEPRTYVEINPDDAGSLDVTDGEEVLVESKQDSIKAEARISTRSPRGIVFLPKNFENEPAMRLSYRQDKATHVKISKIG
ncbi:NADH-ubiquinone oxidoreductase chain G [hydrothermal vent metagenome]|uniref:NADH-ubiquinone oxidoreductase chain G n=1 Tax=hydrothermal vent metagenome TaxID=652676 RepID=A0A3B1CHC6_9ZZZZ